MYKVIGLLSDLRDLLQPQLSCLRDQIVNHQQLAVCHLNSLITASDWGSPHLVIDATLIGE
jgi:hypothetical protein